MVLSRIADYFIECFISDCSNDILNCIEIFGGPKRLFNFFPWILLHCQVGVDLLFEVDQRCDDKIIMIIQFS
jgi:hypothetical protein